MDRLDTYCRSTFDPGELSRPLVIAGASGSGKSSALADWTLRKKEAASGDEPESHARGLARGCGWQELVFYHSVGCSRSSISVEKTLRRLMDALRDHFDLNFTVDENDGRLPWTLPRVIDLASKKGRVLIVIDGIHHIRDTCSDTTKFNLKWLPQSFPSNVRVVLSITSSLAYPKGEFSSPDPVVNSNDHIRIRDGKIQHVIQEVKRRGWQVISIGELEQTHVKNLMHEFQRLTWKKDRGGILQEQPSAFHLLPEMEEAIAHHPEATNPRFLATLFRALAHAASQGYDVWSCLEQWLRKSDSACGLVHNILASFESGHEVTEEKVASSMLRFNRSGGFQVIHKGSEETKTKQIKMQKDISVKRQYERDWGRDTSNIPIYLKGGQDVPGLGPLLGHALALLFVSRHGLHEVELRNLLIRVQENEEWSREQIIRPIEFKIVRSLEQNKNRLIDIFRSVSFVP